MSDDFGSNFEPQRMSETNAEYRERNGLEPLAPVQPARPVPSKVRKPGWSEWTLGLGGSLLIVVGWIISATAFGALRHLDSPTFEEEMNNYFPAESDPSVFFGWQAFGSTLSWIGFGLVLILVSIQAAVSTYFRHLDRR